MWPFKKKQQPVVTQSVPLDATFVFTIEDVFHISGAGTVITGNIVKGEIKVGDIIKLTNGLSSAVSAIQQGSGLVDSVSMGKCGLKVDLPHKEITKGLQAYKM